MPILTGGDLRAAVAVLAARGQRLHHACHLTELRSYVELGGIPSRALMEASGLPFTPFRSDDDDRRNGIWNNVFANIEDFTGFWIGRVNASPYVAGRSDEVHGFGVPNPYGPILFVIDPDVLDVCDDASFSLRSAFVHGFDREEEGLSPIELDACFEEYQDRNGRQRHRLMFKEALRNVPALRRLGRRIDSSPEFCATIEGEVIPFEYVNCVRVDSVHAGDNSLSAVVTNIIGNRARVFDRSYWDGTSRDVYDGLIDLLSDFDPNLAPTPHALLTAAEVHGADEAVRRYLRGLALRYDTNAGFQFTAVNWALYLRDGTLPELERAPERQEFPPDEEWPF